MQADSTNKDGEKNVSRRDLLKVGAALLGASGLTQFFSLSSLQARGKETHDEGGRKWGMLIDINKCIGCNYCTYACQAINNLEVRKCLDTLRKRTQVNARNLL